MATSPSPEPSYSSPEITLDDIMETLSLVMSREAAAALVEKCLREADVEDINTPGGLLGFAEKLIDHGGLGASTLGVIAPERRSGLGRRPGLLPTGGSLSRRSWARG